jgi:hypothetical protein
MSKSYIAILPHKTRGAGAYGLGDTQDEAEGNARAEFRDAFGTLVGRGAMQVHEIAGPKEQVKVHAFGGGIEWYLTDEQPESLAERYQRLS